MRIRPLRFLLPRLWSTPRPSPTPRSLSALRLGVALGVALVTTACGTSPDPAAGPAVPDSSRVEAVADSTAADPAAADPAAADPAAADSAVTDSAVTAQPDALAAADLDSMLAALDLGVAAPAAAPPPADVAAAPPVAAPALSAPALAAPDDASENAEPGAPQAAVETDRIAALEGRIEALTEMLGAVLATQQPADEAVADSAGVGARALDKLGDARETAGQLGWRVFLAFIVGITAFYLIRSLTFLLDTLAARTAERRLFYKRLIPIMRIGIWIFTAYVVVSSIFGLGTNELVAAGAALGVAIGFAAQDVLKNIFGGLIIVFDQPFQVGDKIAVGGTYGEVIEIGLRSTRIVTPDDNLVSVPNAQVADGQVSNANAGALDCQVVTDLYLPGWVDVHQAKQIAYEAASTSRYVYLDKPVVVICKDEFKETFLLHLKVKAYVLDTRYEFLLMSDVTEAAKAAFLKAGLLEPMPVRSYLIEPTSASPAGIDPASSDAQPGASPTSDAAPRAASSAGDGARHPTRAPGTA
ncbi:MAG: mechanosensitive ion channel family protein [Bacteroidota bacterium]